MLKSIFVIAGCLSLTGCLQTREAQKEQEEKLVVRKQLTNLQQTTADVNSRFEDLEENQRRLNGRLEAVEVKLQQASTRFDRGNSGVDQKMKEHDQVYREEFQKLRTEIDQLKSQLNAMNEENRRASEARAQAAAAESAAAAAKAAEAAKNPFAVGEDLFSKKNWKDAILAYEKYRSQNPKGKQVPVATYKIGVSFQELGMIEEAKAFYDEVTTKFPKSKEAEKAAARMKALAGKKK